MKKITILLIFFYTAVVFPQPAGSLDTSFGNGGIVTLDDYSRGGDLAIQSDGKILVAGTYSTIKLWRFNADGTIDNTFISANTSVYDDVSNMFVQSNGKIVVAGNLEILRFNPDGSLDTTFGVGGIVNVSLDILTMKIDVLSNKIIVGGFIQTGSLYSFVIARYESDGTLDTTFNGSGMKVFSPSYSFVTINDIKIDSFHKISASGYYNFDTSYYQSYATNNWVCRVNENGSMDTTFSDDGLLTLDMGSYFSAKLNQSNAMLMKADGSLIIAGTKGSDPYTQRNFSLYELSPIGALADSSMPLSYGFVDNQNDIATSLAVDNNGKFVLAGKTGNGVYQNSFALLRLNADYTADTSFGDNGRVTTFPQAYNNRIENIAIQTDNKIVVVGNITTGSSTPNKLCIARYLASTSLGINQFENNSKVQIFPNPVEKNLYATIHHEISPNDFYKVNDINGRTVLTGLIKSKNLEINVEGLETGIYILITSQSLKPTKFLKN